MERSDSALLKDLKRVLERRIGTRVLAFDRVPKGTARRVYIVRTEADDLILKIAFRKLATSDNEVVALRLMREAGLPVARVLYTNKKLHVVVEERLNGESFSESRLADSARKAVLFEFGRLMRRMHSVKTSGIGPLTSHGGSSRVPYVEFVSKNFYKNLNQVKRSGKVSVEFLDWYERFTEDNLKYLACKSTRLVHGDPSGNNLLVSNGRVSGIIDVGNALSADPMRDIGLMWRLRGDLFRSFMRGYGHVNRDELRKVALYYLISYTSFLLRHDAVMHPDQKRLKANLIETRRLADSLGASLERGTLPRRVLNTRDS